MSQSDDMDAINAYMVTTPIVNTAAVPLVDDWKQWYNDLSYYDKAFDSDTYDLARNKRNAFNLSNVTTPAQQQQVAQTIKGGLTTEEVSVKPGVDPMTANRLPSTGVYNVPEPPLIPTYLKVAIGATAVGAVLVFANAVPSAIMARGKGTPRKSVSDHLKDIRARIGSRIAGT